MLLLLKAEGAILALITEAWLKQLANQEGNSGLMVIAQPNTDLDLCLASVGSGRCREVWIGGVAACQPHVVHSPSRLARRAEWRVAAGALALRTSQAGQMQPGTSPEPDLASAPASSLREPDPFQ